MSSPADSEPVMTCSECGACILETHLKRGLAGMWAGNVLCPSCLREHKLQDSGANLHTGDPGGSRVMASLSDAVSHDLASYRRPLNPTGEGATRVRTFHAKLSEGAIAHMDRQVNAWLDSRPEVEIKFANTTIGVWEGQKAEPTLVLTVFY